MERDAIVSDHAARARDPEVEWLMAIADMLLAILDADRRALNLGQPLLIAVCPGCSVAHLDPDACTVARPA